MGKLLSRRQLSAGMGAVVLAHGLRPRVARGQGLAVTLPLSFVVAEADGQPVVDTGWRAAELAEVARLYAPFGIQMRALEPRKVGMPVAHVETRQDRDSLARDWAPHVINVFVVASLRDVDDGVTVRRGVHWRSSTSPSRRYIIVSAIAGPTVLAHELGHYFGNGHSNVVDNVMSYDRTGALVFFDAAQRARIQASAREALRSGELTALLTAPAAAPR